MLDGLTKKGFKLTYGPGGAGCLPLVYERAGGYYFGWFPLAPFQTPKLNPFLLAEVGASQLIIDGKIGLKSDSVIKEFTKTGLKFEDGSTLEADLVVFATGIGNARDGYEKILGEELGSKVKQIWGLDSTGELKGVWRDIGVDNLWSMTGSLALCRYYSRHVALRKFSSVDSLCCDTDGCGQTEIKAMKEGLFTGRYSLDEN